jgi:hypothetical protein
MSSRFFVKPFDSFPMSPYCMFHIRCVSILSFSYFSLFLTFCMIFLSAGIVTFNSMRIFSSF